MSLNNAFAGLRLSSVYPESNKTPPPQSGWVVCIPANKDHLSPSPAHTQEMAWPAGTDTAHELHRQGGGVGGWWRKGGIGVLWYVGPNIHQDISTTPSPSAGTSQAGRWASSPMNGQWDESTQIYTAPQKTLAEWYTKLCFLCRLNQILVKAAPGMRGAGESSGATVSLRNSGCLLKAVPTPPQLQGGQTSSGSLSSYRSHTFLLRKSYMVKERPNAHYAKSLNRSLSAPTTSRQLSTFWERQLLYSTNAFLHKPISIL